jgi:ParB family chromosome partitioning protein
LHRVAPLGCWPCQAWAPDLAGSPAEKIVQKALQQARDMLPAEAAGLLPWLLAQPLESLLQMLTLCSALSLNAIHGDGRRRTTAPLAAAVGLDRADWWTPTEASYLSAVPKALIAATVQEAGMAQDAKALGQLKKVKAVAKAEALLAGKRWLAAVLR